MIFQVFLDVDLRQGHKGLSQVCLSHKIKPQGLAVGEYVIFINRTRTGLKMFSSDKMLMYLKRPANRPIDLETIKTLPAYFKGDTEPYNQAVLNRLTKALKKNGSNS